MKMTKTLLASALTTLLLTTSAFAKNERHDAPSINKNGFVFTAGYYQGGQVTNPSDKENSNTRAGNGVLLEVGYRFAFSDSPISAQINAGIFNQYEEFSDEQTYTTKRTVIDLIPFYNFDQQQRFGLGLTYHIDPEFYLETTTNDVTTSNDYKLDNALGFIAEYDYQLTDFLYVGARYMRIDYDYNDRKIYNGNTFGINLGFSYK